MENCICKTGDRLISVAGEMLQEVLYYDLGFDTVNNQLDVIIKNETTPEILESSVSIFFCPFCGNKL